jgi:hypothetical protein
MVRMEMNDPERINKIVAVVIRMVEEGRRLGEETGVTEFERGIAFLRVSALYFKKCGMSRETFLFNAEHFYEQARVPRTDLT